MMRKASNELQQAVFRPPRWITRRLIAGAFGAAVAMVLTLGALDARADPQSDTVSTQSEPPTQETAVPVAPKAHARRFSRIRELSDELTAYLHDHRLPHVDANVLGTASGQPQMVELSGEVRTEHGKSDAQQKAADYLSNPEGLQVQNHIEIDPSLGSGPGDVVSASAPASAQALPSVGGDQDGASDPCLCLTDENHCKQTCVNQAAGASASGPSMGLGERCSKDCCKVPRKTNSVRMMAMLGLIVCMTVLIGRRASTGSRSRKSQPKVLINRHHRIERGRR